MKNEAGEYIDNYPMPGDVVEILPVFAETHLLYIKSMEIAVNKALEQVRKEVYEDVLKKGHDLYMGKVILISDVNGIINNLKL